MADRVDNEDAAFPQVVVTRGLHDLLVDERLAAAIDHGRWPAVCRF
jgi:hypothetical protein